MYAILDIETTGGKYNQEQIIELAIYKFDGEKITDTFDSLMRPTQKIQYFVQKLTGITNKKVQDFPEFKTFSERILQITKNCILVAHNAKNDYRFLKNEFERLKIPFERPTLCTFELSKKYIPNAPSHGLDAMCEFLKIPLKKRHRASGDALATLEIFKILLKKKALNPKNKIKNLLENLPDCPGVYEFYNEKETLLYVGKAKNLKKRVASYFVKKHDRPKTQLLVSKIKNIRHIVVESEMDALLLENNLIKKHQPKYNVLLKDDKTYPWICVKKERFPRVFLTRKVIKDGSQYFGPYPAVKRAKVLLELIRELYPLRTCTWDLSEENIRNKKYKVCLEYHIKNCHAPCESYQNVENYEENISAIKEILKGNLKKSLSFFENQMLSFAKKEAFEKAQMMKEKIAILKNYQAKSAVVHPSIHDVDVFSIVSDEKFAYINFFKISNGAIIQSYTLEVQKKMEESDAYLLSRGILELQERFKSSSKEIYVPFEVVAPKDLKITIPKRGDKKNILNLSERNAKYHQKHQFDQRQHLEGNVNTMRILKQMKKDLKLLELPKHIECFDNSNLQGTNPVAACVVFKNAKPAKKMYRHFHIKSVQGPDDFASMEEVVYRRYERLLKEKENLPQLILIDGGKGQIASAVKSLEKLNLQKKITIIGIAKRLEEIFFPKDPVPLYLDKKSMTLKILQQLRDEAHRFGLNFHRKQRTKKFVKTELENIKGVGAKTIEKLLQKYGSVENIKKTSLENLEAIINKKQAKNVFLHFH